MVILPGWSSSDRAVFVSLSTLSTMTNSGWRVWKRSPSHFVYQTCFWCRLAFMQMNRKNQKNKTESTLIYWKWEESIAYFSRFSCVLKSCINMVLVEKGINKFDLLVTLSLGFILWASRQLNKKSWKRAVSIFQCSRPKWWISIHRDKANMFDLLYLKQSCPGAKNVILDFSAKESFVWTKQTTI